MADLENVPFKEDIIQCVSMRVDDQLFGIPVLHVRDVLSRCNITPIPLSPKEVMGVLNLRGRIVTALDFRYILDLPPAGPGITPMYVMIEYEGELFCVLVDSVGEVMSLAPSEIASTPTNLDNSWQDVARGIYPMKNDLLILLNIKRFMELVSGRCWEIGAKL